MNRRALLTFALLASLGMGSAHAQNKILNPSFETGNYVPISGVHNAMSLPVGSSLMDSWEIFADEVAWIDNNNNFAGGLPITSPYGMRYLDLGGQFDIPPYGGVRQTVATIPGHYYVFGISLGSYEGLAGTASPISVSVDFGGTTQTFTSIAPSGTVGNYWQDFTYIFQATAASTQLSILGLPPYQFHAGLDNVSLIETTAPEPGTFVLMGLGISAVALSARRRRR